MILRKARLMILGLVAAFGMTTAAQAALVGTEVTLGYPNIANYDVVTKYDSTTGLLTAKGTPLELIRAEGEAPAPDFFGGSDGDFFLQVKVNYNSTTGQGEADFSSPDNYVHVYGEFDAPIGFTQVFLSNKLLSFGYDDAPGAGLFYFQFKNQINSPIANQSMTIGVLLSAGNVTADFSRDFQSNGGKADTFVPVPTAAASGLVLLTLLGAGAMRRKLVKA